MAIRLDSGVARFGVPGLFLGVALSWFAGSRGPEAVAQTGLPGTPTTRGGGSARLAEPSKGQAVRPSAGGDSNGTLAFLINPVNSAGQLLTIIDTKERAFALYRIDTSGSKTTVKLEASRQYQWDLKIEQYNNLAPEPAAIEAMIRTPGHPTR